MEQQKSLSPPLIRGIIAANVALSLLVAARLGADAAPAPPVFVDGTQAEVAAIDRHGRVFVPIRSVFGHLGTVVDYTPPNRITARKNNADIANLTIDRREAIVRGNKRLLEVAPFRYQGRTFVPLRLISESAGARVTYTRVPREVRITSALSAVAAVVPAVVPAPVVTASPVATEQNGLPWWLWPLLALLLLLALLAFFLSRRRKADPVIVTRSTPRDERG